MWQALLAQGVVNGINAGISISAQLEQAEQQARIFRNNALLTRHQIGATREQSIAQIGELRKRVNAQAAQVAAAGAASGATGAAYDRITRRAAVSAAQDSERLRAAAERQAWGYGQQAANFEVQAQQAEAAGVLGAVSTGIGAIGGTASSAASMYGRS